MWVHGKASSLQTGWMLEVFEREYMGDYERFARKKKWNTVHKWKDGLWLCQWLMKHLQDCQRNLRSSDGWDLRF